MRVNHEVFIVKESYKVADGGEKRNFLGHLEARDFKETSQEVDYMRSHTKLAQSLAVTKYWDISKST